MAIFWRTFYHDGKISPAWWGRGCTPSPFHSICHHEQSCAVRSSWEGRYTPPISPLPIYVLCGHVLYGRHCIVLPLWRLVLFLSLAFLYVHYGRDQFVLVLARIPIKNIILMTGFLYNWRRHKACKFLKWNRTFVFSFSVPKIKSWCEREEILFFDTRA
jgi:hypothetical protein